MRFERSAELEGCNHRPDGQVDLADDATRAIAEKLPLSVNIIRGC